jgi:hypothetical protein
MTNSGDLDTTDMALALADRPEGGKITVNGPKATVTVEGPHRAR